MKITPRSLRWLLNFYPPYIGAGVSVDSISHDWKEVKVSMQLRWYNRNAVRTHFGGSLYSMVDPHLMLMLMQLLGSGYIVWDKAAEITFHRPGKGRVSAVLSISEENLEAIKAGVEEHRKITPRFDVDIFDESGKVVAHVKKVLYVRKKNRVGNS